MDVLIRWFVEQNSLDELREQCPFVNTYSEEYLRCFINTYNVDEFDWIRYIRDNPKLHLKDELSAYNVWMRTGRTGAFVVGSESIFNGFPWSAYLQSNRDLTNAKNSRRVSRIWPLDALRSPRKSHCGSSRYYT